MHDKMELNMELFLDEFIKLYNMFIKYHTIWLNIIYDMLYSQNFI